MLQSKKPSKKTTAKTTTFAFSLASHQNVVDRNMNKLDKESNKAHNQKSDSRRPSNQGKFLAVRFGALFDQMDRVLGKLLEWLN
jgi:hypothetical protein